MRSTEFDEILTGQMQLMADVLGSKAKEYATDDDRLHNFKVAAHLTGGTQVQAVGGMMSKHTISVYDMIKSGEDYTLDLWDEKIGDHINYLVLLKAAVIEQLADSETKAHADKVSPEHQPGPNNQYA